MTQFLHAHLFQVLPHEAIHERVQTKRRRRLFIGDVLTTTTEQHVRVLLETYESEQIDDSGDSRQARVQLALEFAGVEHAESLLDERPMRRIGHAESAQVGGRAFRQRDEIVAGANEQLVVGVETDALQPREDELRVGRCCRGRR